MIPRIRSAIRASLRASMLASLAFFAAAAVDSLDAAPRKAAVPAGPTPLERAVTFERDINAGKLTADQFAQTFADLLKIADGAAQSSDAIFIRALLHAAAAQWLGQANNGVTARYLPDAHTAADAPAWLRFYAAATHDDLVAYDYIRSLALARNITAADTLRSEVLDYLARARRMGETALADALLAHLLHMSDLGGDAAGCRAEWLAARRLLRPAALARAGLDKSATSVLLYTRNAYHYKPNVCGAQVSWAYKPGGDILAVNLATHETKSLLRERLGPGHLHGFDLWFDGDRVAFSYAPQPVWPPAPQFETVWPAPERSNACFAFELRERLEPPHLYELDLRTDHITPLTDHNYWSDTEPAYLPDGSVAFASDRSAHSPSCDSVNNELTDLNIYTLTADRKTVRRLLNHKDIDTHPRLLNNGTLAYLRWEYQERDFMEVHSVWTARPDGSGADALFKQHIARPYSVRLATPLPPPDNRLVAVATGHHCLPQGALVLLDPATGPNNPAGIRLLTRGITIPEGNIPYPAPQQGGVSDPNGTYTDPQPVTSESFLASYAYPSPRARRYSYYPFDADANGYGTYLVDVFGNKELIHRDPYLSTYNAVPLRPRHKPPVLGETTDRSKNYATCTIADVYQGVEGVARGTIKSIRISEALPWPIVPSEGVKRWSEGWTRNDKKATRWCPVRIIGEVPVESDGSAHFKVPVTDSASVYFQALDENKMEIRRMRSSVSFAPGEIRGCTGCHETNDSSAAGSPRTATALALRRRPADPVPPAWGADTPIHFPRDVQPILTKNCVSCHSGTAAKAGLDFSEGKALRTILGKKLVVNSSYFMNGSITKVKQFGSHVSRLTQAVLKARQATDNVAMRVALTDAEWHALVTWVDANTPHSGMMFNLRTADGRQKVWTTYDWPAPWGQPKETPAIGAKLPKPLAVPTPPAIAAAAH